MTTEMRPLDSSPPLPSIQHDALEAALISRDQARIGAIFAQFEANGDLSGLSEATQILERFEDQHRRLWQQDRQELALTLGTNVQEMRAIIQRMNFGAPRVTTQDILALQSFVMAPAEKFYIDDTGEKYYQPNHSHLLTAVTELFAKGSYRGVGVSKKQAFIHPETHQKGYYDLLYLTKLDDQIAYETAPTYEAGKQRFHELYGKTPFVAINTLGWATKEELDERKRIQSEEKEKLQLYFQDRFAGWSYASFQICTHNDLLQLGMPPETSPNIQGVVFYHKKYSPSQREPS